MNAPENLPKVTVAVADAEVRRRMLEILRNAEVDVAVAPAGTNLTETLAAGDADLVVVRRSQLSARSVEKLEGSQVDAPGVVVLTEDADPAERTHLLASGAAAVMPVDDSLEEFAETVEQLAQAEVTPAAGSATEPRLADFFTRSPRMKEFMDLVRQVARTDSSLLITGETGVGKEHLARAIHNEGARSESPFISVNCGALPEQLLESELFGHEAGAFTGAETDRRGRFLLADGGTILLDEIGEMPSHLQVRLLAILQSRQVAPLGSEKEIPIDVRVMAATNRNIEEELSAGRLREDLYYRLNVVTLTIPALRQRTEDLPDLIGRFLQSFRESMNRPDIRSIAPLALEALLAYSWPGNVRELMNVLERAILVASGSQITVEDLPPRLVGGRKRRSKKPEAVTARELTLPEDIFENPLRESRKAVIAQFERRYLKHALQKHRGHIAATARHAGITPRALNNKMRQHRLRKEDFF